MLSCPSEPRPQDGAGIRLITEFLETGNKPGEVGWDQIVKDLTVRTRVWILFDKY